MFTTHIGKNRSQAIEWQDTLILEPEQSAHGCCVKFVFNVPEDLPTTSEKGRNYYVWMLKLSAEVEGIDLNREFEIPVFSTKQFSSIQLTEKNSKIKAMVNQETITGLMNMRKISGGIELFYKAGRVLNVSINLIIGSFIFGYFWAITYMTGAPLIFPIGMALSAILLLLIGLYTLGNSLMVRIDDQQLLYRRRLFGILIREITVPRVLLHPLTLERGMQSGSVIFYNIVVRTSGYQSIKIGESFSGIDEAKAALKRLCEAADLQCDSKYQDG